MSFLALLAVPTVILLGVATVRKVVFRKPWPNTKDACQTLAISCGITVGITAFICLMFSWTGFFDNFFYRPSQRDYGEHRQLTVAPQDLNFTSGDGTPLHGWWLPAAADAVGTVIHLHGSDRNVTYTIRNCAWLTAHGFNVFAVDYRGYGQSAGAPSRDGLIQDCVAAIEYIQTREDLNPTKICLWGQSMGGQLAIVAASQVAQGTIKAVAAEATYARHSDHIKDKMAQLGPLWLMQWGAWLFTSDNQSADRVVQQIDAPLLLIHGQADTGVLPYHSERLYAAASDPKELWRLDGVGHLKVFPDEVNQRRLVTFFQDAVSD